MQITDTGYYCTIDQTATAEFKDRGSRFIAYAYPVDNIDASKLLLKQIKKEHPKASHHCFAYRISFDGSIYRSSDDGEPSGTAGKPILNQLLSKNITDVLVIVVRYFGGTLLGTQGLINAYKTAAVLVLQTLPIIRKPVLQQYELEFNYNELNAVLQIAKQFQCEVKHQELQLFCLLKVDVPQIHHEQFLFAISQLKDVNIKK